ncbi:hypothetical protein Tco_0949793 [Tanacetum coccineum]
MPHDSPLSGGHTPRSDEGSTKLNELTELCTKLSDKITILEDDLKQTKKIYGKALTKLVKKVKQLEAKLKSTTERRKARMVIFDDKEDLVSDDTSKQGRMTEIEYKEVEINLNQTDDDLQRRSIIEEIDLVMSSSPHSTITSSEFNMENAFSSMNILNYTPVSSDYFPASSGSISFNSSENSNIIPSVISPFYNNPCLKDVQAFYAKESPISPPDPIIPPAILTPSPVLPPSLLFDPRYFFVPEELLPPKKQIHSSSTTLSNSSRNQTCNLVLPSFSVYTPTPPQIFEIGKSSIKMHLKHHEEQIEDILNYLDELSFHHIKKMEEGHINIMIIRRNGNELKTELKRIRTQIIKLHKKQLGQKDKIAFAHYRISNLKQIIEEIQARLYYEDANLKFLRSLPSVWHVVATMIRGQPGLDELDFDDLYNNLKVTSRQSTADDKSEIITKGYAQASSSKLKETLNSSFNSDDEDLLQIDDDAMEEIDIR